MEKKCWNPVLYASQLTESPVPITLCGISIAVWRGSKGLPHAVKDLCIHRGAALSLGKVCQGEIVCPYHGWRFKPNLLPMMTHIRNYFLSRSSHML